MITIKRFLFTVCLLTLLLFSFSVVAHAEDIPQPPAQAVVDSPINGAANLCNLPDDYFTPQAVYFNGTPLSVVEIVPTHGDYPVELLKDKDERWAKVVIGKTETYPGIEGFIPLAALNFNQTDVKSLLQASLESDNGSTPMYLDNGLSDQLVGEFPNGSPVQVLGWLMDWAHVKHDDKTGFVRQETLILEEGSAEILYDALPHYLDEIQPGHQARYEAYREELMKLYTQHGDSNEWPLEIKAKASELAARHGYRFTTDINVMPEATDLSGEDVLAKAKAAAKERYGLPEDVWVREALSFSYPEGDPDAKGWKVNLWAKAGMADVVVWLNRSGEITESMINDFSREESGESETTYQASSPVEEYLYGKEAQPGSGDIALQQAEDLAWQQFEMQNTGFKREEVRFESRFMQNDEGDKKWWLVRIFPPFPGEWDLSFDIALLAPDGSIVHTTIPEIFAETLDWGKRQVAFEQLIRERGPYNTWTLEQKAEWDPDFYGFPSQDEIPLDRAIAIARARLIKDFQLTEAELDKLQEGIFFEISEGRSWRISYMSAEGDGETEHWAFYSISIDPKTGKVTNVLGPSGVE